MRPVLRRGFDAYNLMPAGQARALGFGFGFGYLGGDPGKDVTRAKVDAYHAAGLDVPLNFEGSGADATTGFAGGVARATAANRQADQLGAPATVGIYYSADAALSAAEVAPYFQGLASVRNSRRRGAYGGTELLVPLQEDLISWWWQSMSGSWSGWSNDQFPTDPRAAVRQVYVSASSPYDLDEQMVADCGFWAPPGAAPAVQPPSTSWEDDNMISKTIPAAVPGQTPWPVPIDLPEAHSAHYGDVIVTASCDTYTDPAPCRVRFSIGSTGHWRYPLPGVDPEGFITMATGRPVVFGANLGDTTLSVLNASDKPIDIRVAYALVAPV